MGLEWRFFGGEFHCSVDGSFVLDRYQRVAVLVEPDHLLQHLDALLLWNVGSKCMMLATLRRWRVANAAARLDLRINEHCVSFLHTKLNETYLIQCYEARRQGFHP